MFNITNNNLPVKISNQLPTMAILWYNYMTHVEVWKRRGTFNYPALAFVSLPSTLETESLLCVRNNPIVGLFFWQLRSGDVSGQWTSETRLPVPNSGPRAGVWCRRAVSLPVRSLLPPVQVWGKKSPFSPGHSLLIFPPIQTDLCHIFIGAALYVALVTILDFQTETGDGVVKVRCVVKVRQCGEAISQ